MTGGTYTLVVSLEATTLTFGAAGERSLRAGPHAYIGSALGGGFTRVERHRELVAGERDTRHWHIDYLLGAPSRRSSATVACRGATPSVPSPPPSGSVPTRCRDSAPPTATAPPTCSARARAGTDPWATVERVHEHV